MLVNGLTRRAVGGLTMSARGAMLLLVPFRGLTIESYASMSEQVKLPKPVLPHLTLGTYSLVTVVFV